MSYNYNDGGRAKYFKGKNVRDCVVRSITIATGKDYKEVYEEVAGFVGYSPRNGVKNKDIKKLLAHMGGSWHPTMAIGSGCKVHLTASELPGGRIICNCSGHLVAVVDGVINDLEDCSRGGSRCVYGYWTFY